MPEKEISLADYWQVLVGRRRLIAYTVGAAFVISCIVSLILPKEYKATASILQPRSNDNLFAARAAGATGIIPAEFLSGMAGFSGDVWVGILESQTVSDDIIKRFNLGSVYGCRKIEDTRKRLWKMVNVFNNKKEGIIKISVLDESPARAAAMANAFVEDLDRVNKNLVMTSGRRTRIFVGQRLDETKKNLDAADKALEEFQQKYRAVNLGDQSKVIIQSIAAVKGKLMAKEVELQTLLSYATPDNPQVQILSSEKRELQRRLGELENKRSSSYSGKGSQDIFVPTNMMPALELDYDNLMRDKSTDEALYKLLVRQYEMAKIQEVKNSSTVQVLDRAVAPTKKAKPRRILIVISCTFTALVLAAFAAFFLDYLEGTRRGGMA